MKFKLSSLIILLAALKLVLPFLLQHPIYELHRDEYLYYQQGQHLSLGYLENPPFIGWLGYLSSLAGGTFITIKLWPAMIGALTLLVTTALTKELGGHLFAQAIAALGILATAYLRVHFLFQPNFLEIFCWTTAAYFLIRYINTASGKYLYLLSMTLALGWWSKYSVLFFIAALAMALMLTQHRKIFMQKHFWGAFVLGVLLIAPNMVWQYQHNWPLEHHMAELRATQLQYLSRADFLKEQLVMLLSMAFVWIGGLVWLLKNKPYRVLAFTYLLVIGLLMLGSGKGYYTLGTYPMLLAAGGVWLQQISVEKRWIRYAAVVMILALALPFVPVLLPMQSPQAMAQTNRKYGLESLGLLKWEDRKTHALQQDFADMLGWQELTAKTEKFFLSLPNKERVATIVYCRNYSQAGSLLYYAKSSFFKSKIISDNGSFLLWIPDQLYFNNLLFVGRNMPSKEDEVFQHFARVTVVDSVTNPLSRQYGDKIIYFQQADALARQLANKDIRQMKSVFQRRPQTQ